jgi:soluble lytic murein transglycosylase
MTVSGPRIVFAVFAAACLIAIVPFRDGEVEKLFAVDRGRDEARPALSRAAPMLAAAEPDADLIAAVNDELGAPPALPGFGVVDAEPSGSINFEVLAARPEPVALDDRAGADPTVGAASGALALPFEPESPASPDDRAAPSAGSETAALAAAPELAEPDNRDSAAAADLALPAGSPASPIAIPEASAPASPALPQPTPSRASEAAVLYHKGDAAGLAALAKAASDPAERLALEWASLRIDPHPTFATLAAFNAAHPRWPGAGWIHFREEAELAVHPDAPAKVAAFFAAETPQSSAGRIAAARAANAGGRVDEAGRIIRALWREGSFDLWTEVQILREFGPLLSRADHKHRADRLIYAENFASGMRAAYLAGPDETALVEARIAASRGPLNPALLRAVPVAMRSDPGLLFALIQDARRSNRPYEAATLLSVAPVDHAALVNPDRWWSERRMVARQLLDLDEPRLAFEICDNAARPDDPAAQVDAAFHAGWIALRFLNDAPAAAARFARAADAAETPLSIARAAYWRGRAAEAMGETEAAKLHYDRAASEPIAYYGQLAAARLGQPRLALRAPVSIAEGDRRDEAVGAVAALYAEGIDELASGLAFEAAQGWRDEAQLAAMAEVVNRYGVASTQLQFGKLATMRGYPFDAMAFPAAGLPAFVPLAHSADLASVLAVARQESEFLWRAASGAGAKGLMQLMPATAAMTARRAGVAFDYARLLADPAFNTQLGAEFLGEVLEDEGGSRELAFAAYNAGGGRVAQWIAQHGDPRKGGADLVDWIERIPFDETRDYVQRVSENLAVYRQRLADDPPKLAPISAFVARE